MSVDQLASLPPLTALDVDRRIEAASDASLQPVDGELPRVVILPGAATVATLLLLVSRGDQAAFAALQSRMAGLVLVNVRRVLRDASRSEVVTQETFAEVLEDAIHFDPNRDDAQTWVLSRAHQHAMDRLHSTDPHDQKLEQPALV